MDCLLSVPEGHRKPEFAAMAGNSCFLFIKYGHYYTDKEIRLGGRAVQHAVSLPEKGRVASGGYTCCLRRVHVLPLEGTCVNSRSLQILPVGEENEEFRGFKEFKGLRQAL